MIHEIAHKRLGSDTLPKILVKQAITEIGFVLRQKGATFRKRNNDLAVKAYSEMGGEEFEWINARQRWANWRTIPKNLSGALPNRPIVALDLCCGAGHSTEVLACYLPLGSRILGIDASETFIGRARKRRYTHRNGRLGRVSFQVQSVLETFRDANGEKLGDASVDLVNASGAIGCHFDEAATTLIAREVARVLKSGGLATIDSGAPGTNTNQLIRIFQAEGFGVSRTARSCFADPYTQVCFRKY